MKGIDIASYQANLDISKVSLDFAIVKATEGVGYVNPYCDKHVQQLIAAGKKFGVYHFARNKVNSARAEAEYFVQNIQGYVKKGILVLDWEDGVADVKWAKEFLDRVFELTGVKPLIYMSESVVNSYDWTDVAKADYGLWVAKYRDYVADFNYDTTQAGSVPSVKYWNGYAMWQWTSSGRLDGYDGNLDLNEAYMDEAAWDKYAGGEPGKAAAAIANPQPSAVVDPTYTVKKGDSLSAVFPGNWKEVAAYNGLTNPNIIYPGQVLRIPSGVKTGQAPASPRTHTVGRGENLSTIAAKYGTDYQTLARINGLANANLIFPGQVLRLP